MNGTERNALFLLGYHVVLAVKALRCSLGERLDRVVVALLAALLAESRRRRREPVTAALPREFSSPMGNPAHAKTRGLGHEPFNHFTNRSTR